MSYAFTMVVVRVMLAALAAAAPLSADQACPLAEGRPTALLRCRGSLSMGGRAAPSHTDADLALHFRAPREPSGNALLEPGTCTWADRPPKPHEPHVIMLPLNGPLAVAPYPIGHQALVCAADNACTMEFCAYDKGYELRAVDGFIRLAFGGFERGK